MGGLGNQMFEYAAGFVAAKHAGTAFKLDNLYYRDHSRRWSRFEYRPFALGLLNISGTVATPDEISRFTYPRKYNKYLYHFLRRFHRDCNVLTETDFPDSAALASAPADCYLKGYFQRYEYFGAYLDSLKKEFSFREPLPESSREMADEIRCGGSNAVCIVFRRGDYVGHPVLDVVTLDFYYRALEVLDMPDARLFVFSDDIPWCRANFTPPRQFYRDLTFVDQKFTGPMGGEYLQLMMLCGHFIIPNSTYPYWAALLSETNPGKKVIAPKVWFNGQNPDIRNTILPPDWIAI